MSRPAAIIDTNVVVAGLLTADPASPVARILDGMLGAAFPFVVSEVLLAEYHAVLVRPHLRKLHGLTLDHVESVLTAVAQSAILLRPPGAAQPTPDPGDQLLWDLLCCKQDLLLVTGDKRLLRDTGMRGRVVAPRTFLSGE